MYINKISCMCIYGMYAICDLKAVHVHLKQLCCGCTCATSGFKNMYMCNYNNCCMCIYASCAGKAVHVHLRTMLHVYLCYVWFYRCTCTSQNVARVYMLCVF